MNDVQQEGQLSGENEPQSYETALARLEEIVALLDRGDVPLADSLALLEEAVKLKDYCHNLLAKAEARLEVLVETPDGGTRIEPLTEGK